MAQTAWKTAGAVAAALYDPGLSGGGESWSNPTNAQGSPNGTVATMDMGALTPGQRYSLRASSFGFADGDVPVGSTISAIEFRPTKRNNLNGGSQTIVDQYMYMVGTAGTLGIGSNKADTTTAWPTSLGTVVYTFNSSLPTQTEIKNSNFGCHLTPNTSGAGFGNSLASVDSWECRITYTAPATHDPGKDMIGFL